MTDIKKITNCTYIIHPSLKDMELSTPEIIKQGSRYGVKLKADSYTMHPPRVRVCDMPVGGNVWKAFLPPYMKVVERALPTARMGVENIHKSATEPHDDTRGFGYIPSNQSEKINFLSGSRTFHLSLYFTIANIAANAARAPTIAQK